MRNSTESRYIEEIDRPPESKIEERSFLAERILVDLLNHRVPDWETRLSTPEEDSGREDIGPKTKVDAVTYNKGKKRKPILTIQATSADDQKTRNRKMQELAEHPFVRIEGVSVPKALVFLSRDQITSFAADQNLDQHPEIALQVFNSIIISLRFDLSKTQNPQEQLAIKALIQTIEAEKKRLVS